MSLTSVLRSPATPTSAFFPTSPIGNPDIPFQQQPTYLTLTRMLIRFQHIILLQPRSETLTPIQSEVQAELRASLPFHRTKWLRNVEHARTLLLQLEHAAQEIKVQRLKRDVVHDLAQKRVVIKKLRKRIEDIGREVEAVTESADDSSKAPEGLASETAVPGDTLEEILGRSPWDDDKDNEKMLLSSGNGQQSRRQHDALHREGTTPVACVEHGDSRDDDAPSRGEADDGDQVSTGANRQAGRGVSNEAQRDDGLFSSTSSSTRQRRRANNQDGQRQQATTTKGATEAENRGKSSGVAASGPGDPPPPPAAAASTTENRLRSDLHERDDLTTSLVDMATQLKQQARTFQARLAGDKTLVDRALERIETNSAAMEVASKSMGALRRMSEGQGWWGRMKLYALIAALWLAAILIVFVGPKLRF